MLRHISGVRVHGRQTQSNELQQVVVHGTNAAVRDAVDTVCGWGLRVQMHELQVDQTAVGIILGRGGKNVLDMQTRHGSVIEIGLVYAFVLTNNDRSGKLSMKVFVFRFSQAPLLAQDHTSARRRTAVHWCQASDQIVLTSVRSCGSAVPSPKCSGRAQSWLQPSETLATTLAGPLAVHFRACRERSASFPTPPVQPCTPMTSGESRSRVERRFGESRSTNTQPPWTLRGSIRLWTLL